LCLFIKKGSHTPAAAQNKKTVGASGLPHGLFFLFALNPDRQVPQASPIKKACHHQFLWIMFF
jgi:hypothetical protein